MRSLLFLAVFAMVSGRSDCNSGVPHDPCGGKKCGDACRLCALDAKDCVETAIVKGCDPAGLCTALGTFTCEPPPTYDPCSGKAQCDACTICPPYDPDCVETAVLKVCDAAGQCVMSTGQCKPPPYDPCAGKRCGDDCVINPPCYPLCMMPSFLGKCDAALVCQPVRQVTCAPPPPVDPCAGKRCGDACTTCSPTTDVMCIAVMEYCDGVGRCGPAYPVCAAAVP